MIFPPRTQRRLPPKSAFILRAASAALFSSLASFAHAAQTVDQPPAARPGVSPDRADQAPAGVRERPAAAVSAPPPVAAPRVAQPFVLRTVEIAGSSLPAGEISAAYAPFVGRSLDAAGLQTLIEAVKTAYTASDIAVFTVAAPPQSFQNGVLRLQVVEGYVATAVIKGRVDGKVQKRITEYLKPVAAERPLAKPTLQRQISLIREIPGFDAQIGFERANDPTGLRLVVDGQTHPFQIGVGVNTRGTAFLGKNQGQIDLIANSLVTGGDQWRVSYAQPIGRDDYRSITVGYVTPLNSDGLTLSVNAGKLDTQPRAIPLKGQSKNAGVQVSWAALRGFERNLTLTAGLDGVDSDNAFLGYTFANDRTRSLRAAAAYSRLSPKAVTSVSATLSVGAPGLGARTTDAQVSETDFKKLNLRLFDTRVLPHDLVWRTNLAAQASSDRLPGTEQMAAGGDEFGRAFETAIISGDSGYAASGELAWRPTKGLPTRLVGSEVYGFVDGARLNYKSRYGLPDNDSKLASVGGGVRVRTGKRSVAQLEAVRGLNNPVTYENREVWRLMFSVRSVVF